MNCPLMPAWVDPVETAQATFRHALSAMSRPGHIHTLDNLPAPEPLAPATYLLLLTLLDASTPLWLADSFNNEAVRLNLAFHCACPITRSREQAAFALLDESALHDLSGFDTGSERYPDESCTLIVQLDSLHGGPSTRWQGPGIFDMEMGSLPVPQAFWRARAAQVFPLGFDCLFTAAHQLMALPRSTRIQYDEKESGRCTSQ